MTAAADPFLWLEEVDGAPALAWVRERNAETAAQLETRADFVATRDRLQAVFDAPQRIPHVTRRGDWLYNFWRGADRPRGLWRRTTLAEYRRDTPAWETVLDLDALGAVEGENWVWGGAQVLMPEGRLALVMLSRGGADAHVVREFDTVAKAFVAGGYVLPEAKSQVEWIDENTIYVGTDIGPGSLTDSGYPRLVQRWPRGTPIEHAVTLFEADPQHVWVTVSVDRTPGFERTLLSRGLDFFRSQYFLLEGGQAVPLDIPDDASLAFMHSAGEPGDTLLLSLRSEWAVGGQVHAAGSLLAADTAAYLAGERRFQTLFAPTSTRSLAGFGCTRSHVIVNVLDQVTSHLEEWRRTPQGFVQRTIAAPAHGTLSADTLHDPLLKDDPLAEAYLLDASDHLSPDALWLAHTGNDAREWLKSLPAVFDASGMHTAQFFATSADGTQVPYFVVSPANAVPGTPLPTLLYGYGGFEISMTPSYASTFGPAWLERGGVFVVANIRGGGEFGPAWHRAAMREHKQRSYDDFIAVAEDLIARRITTPRHLGIRGGSNGGLLVAAVALQRPELFNAVVCQVPLLDMRRFHLLLAGASWVAEYGNPDLPEDWAFISTYSPYQNLRADVFYPPMLITTSTRDDRVHPGHARKFAARLRVQGHELLYYENIEGGHGGAADNAQLAHMQALGFIYLWSRLGAH